MALRVLQRSVTFEMGDNRRRTPWPAWERAGVTCGRIRNMDGARIERSAKRDYTKRQKNEGRSRAAFQGPSTP